MNPDPTMPTWRRWWTNQSKGRKALMVGGATVVALAAGSAAAGGAEPPVRSDSAASAPAGEPSTTPSTAARATTERPIVTQRPPTTAAPVTTAAPSTTVVSPPTQPVTYTVTHIVDGDTLDVTPSDGSPPVRVRMVGIDAPEHGTCEADAATSALAGLVQDRQVVLTPGGDGEDTDRHGRSLRYVDLDGSRRRAAVDRGWGRHRPLRQPGRLRGAHAGGHLRGCRRGVADVRLPASADARASADDGASRRRRRRRLLRSRTAPAPPNAGDGCDPNYSGCVPIDSDVDCAGGSGNGPSYTGHVRVIGTDIYDLDGDGDGEACE